MAFPTGWTQLYSFTVTNPSATYVLDQFWFTMRTGTGSDPRALYGVNFANFNGATLPDLRISDSLNNLVYAHWLKRYDSVNGVAYVQVNLDTASLQPGASATYKIWGLNNAATTISNAALACCSGFAAATAPAAFATPSNGFAHGMGIALAADGTTRITWRSNDAAADTATTSAVEQFTRSDDTSTWGSATTINPSGMPARPRCIGNCLETVTHSSSTYTLGIVYDEADASPGTSTHKVLKTLDNGGTWAIIATITSPFSGNGPLRLNGIIQLGTTIYAYGFGHDITGGHVDAIVVFQSTDGGATWTQSVGAGEAGVIIGSPTGGKVVNECIIVRTTDDSHLAFLGRGESGWSTSNAAIVSYTAAGMTSGWTAAAEATPKSVANTTYSVVTPGGTYLPNGFILYCASDRVNNEMVLYISRDGGRTIEYHTAVASLTQNVTPGGSGNTVVMLGPDNLTCTLVWNDGNQASNPTTSNSKWSTFDYHWPMEEWLDDAESALPASYTVTGSVAQSTTQANSPTHSYKSATITNYITRSVRQTDTTPRANCSSRLAYVEAWWYSDSLGTTDAAQELNLADATTPTTTQLKIIYSGSANFGIQNDLKYWNGAWTAFSPAQTAAPAAWHVIGIWYDVAGNTATVALDGVVIGHGLTAQGGSFGNIGWQTGSRDGGTAGKNLYMDDLSTGRYLPYADLWTIAPVTSGKVFRPAPMDGMGTGGPFFPNQIG